MMRVLLVVVLAAASSACLRKTEYRCSPGDNSCGVDGQCESTGYCSFRDGDCASGRRYNDSAGSLGGTCTSGGTIEIDSNDTDIDMSMEMTDTMPDTPVAAQCPNGYNTITDGNPGHQYMKIAGAATWANQEAACQLTTVKSHLAVPDDLTELTALDTLMGNGVTTYWIGVTDQVPPSTAEGTFYNVLGVAQTFLPWDPPAPDDAGPGEDCVEALQATHEFNDARCNFTRPAVCECAP